MLSAIFWEFIDPLSLLPLMCIWTGLVTNEKVTKDMLLAETLGEAAMRKFLDIRLGEQRAACFFRSSLKNEVGHLSEHEEIETI